MVEPYHEHVSVDQCVKLLGKKLTVRVEQDLSGKAFDEALPEGVAIPDGYELACYTVRRARDGYLQSYAIDNGVAVRVPVIPTLTQNHNSLSSRPSIKPHTFNIPIREGRENLSHPENSTRPLSSSTQKRHAHLRDDGYTDVCGVFSPEVTAPVKKYNYGKGDFCCPRCGSNFTRPFSVRDHFPSCVTRYGNPQALRYSDHPTMRGNEVGVRRRSESTSLVIDGNDMQMDACSSEDSLEETYVTLCVDPFTSNLD